MLQKLRRLTIVVAPSVMSFASASLAAERTSPSRAHPEAGFHGESVAAHSERRDTTKVTGVVHDSVRNQPLGGALVQLVAADSLTNFGQTTSSDSLGRFVFTGVPNGRYTLGFFHDMLDSLGLAPMMRPVTVAGELEVRVDLAIPAPTRIRAAMCGAANAQNAAAVATGVVRDARTRDPVAGATVTAEWIELSVGRGSVGRRTVRRVATTGENGWYSLCDVPSPGALVLMANRGADSTDFVEVQVPNTGYLRQELYLGRVRTVSVSMAASGDSARRSDSLSSRVRRIHVGDIPLRGSAVSAVDGRPLADAQVFFANGPQARANARGEWSMTDAPGGTRLLEIRAVGFYPERRTVNVVEGAPPVRVELKTYKSVIDTLKVVAQYDRFSNLEGFRQRSRSGLGRFLTAEDIAKRSATVTTDLFMMVPGLFVDGVAGIDRTVTMKGLFTDTCAPAVYLNGSLMVGLSASDIDLLVPARNIQGIEVYSQSQAPPQFVPGLSDCGSIVFWTR